MTEIRNPKEARSSKSEEDARTIRRHSDLGFRISFGFRISDFGIALAAALLLFAPLCSRAAFVYETPAEFLASGDFNADGLPDVLVLDKATGNARVGYQSPGGALAWSPPYTSGIENVTGVGIGRFVSTNHDAIAATAPDFNRIALLDVPIPGSNSPPAIILPGLTQATNGLIAAWDFLSLPPTTVSTATPATIPAPFGMAMLDVSAFGLGSPQGSNPERTSFTGTMLNVVPESVDGNPGTALALANSSANGKAAIFSFSMAGYRDLVVSFATRGTSTGFNSGVWAWSTDGINYQTLAGVNTASTNAFFSTTVVNFATATGLNNADTVYLRYTLSGATSASGNNRIDNVQLNATPIAAGGIGPQGLAGLPAPFGTNAPFDRLLCASSQNPTPAARLNLLGLNAGAVVASAEYAETAPLERVNPLPLASNLTFAAGLTRGATNDALHIWQFTNSPGVIATVSNLPPGSDYAFGRFNNEALPRFWFYVPGGTNVTIRAFETNGNGLAFGAATILDLTQAVERVYIVGTNNDQSAMLHFGDCIQGVRLPGGTPSFAPKHCAGAGETFTGIAVLSDGKFILLSAPTGTVSSLTARVMTFDGTNYTQISSTNLPAVTTPGTRATVWLFQSEPFTNAAASLIASLNVPDWSSGVSGLPGALAVRVESDSGTTSGLGGPATNNLGAPPAGTTYALPEQYRIDISFFSYAPPRAAEPVVVSIAPPPGDYGAPIQISFIKQNPAHEVRYRIGTSANWNLYAAPFPLTNDATIQFYGSTPTGTRGRIQFASYTVGNLVVPPEPLIPLPGSGTNPPPTVNTSITRISANGTVVYGRRSPLGTLNGFLGPSFYLSFADSPFYRTNGLAYFYTEDFEDGALNTPGATPSAGWVVAAPGSFTDSVDGDDGTIDGSGAGGHSYYSGGTRTNLTITFNAAALGGKLPTHAGIVWTDVGVVTSGTTAYGNVIFSALDANGLSLGTRVGINLGDGVGSATTTEDRFFVVVNAGGISSISITMTNSVDWEVDHLQYGRLDAAGFSGSLWAINLDGSGEDYITTGFRPRVSRDGRWMSFLREHDPATNQFSLWVRDLATGAEARLHSSSNRYVGHDWTADNAGIVFDNNCLFWRMGLTGGVARLPLPNDCLQAAPSVNPLDGRLAFQIIFPGQIGLYLAPSNAASKQNLGLSVQSPRWPAWSPDGQRIAIADDPIQSSAIDAGRNLWVVSLGAQTNVFRITALPGGAGFPNGAVWTHGGNQLVGAGRLGGTNGLWVIPLTLNLDACAAPPQRLPTSPGDEIDFAGSVVATSVTVSYANVGLFIRLEPGAVVVYWSTNYDGFTLESAANLPAGLIWTPVSGPYFRAGPYFEYRESRAALAARRYFRLHYPGVLILTPPEPEVEFHLEPAAAVLNWPLNYVGYTLEAATNLSPPVLWTPLGGPYLNTNGVFEYRRALPGPPQEFYRLRWP